MQLREAKCVILLATSVLCAMHSHWHNKLQDVGLPGCPEKYLQDFSLANSESRSI